MDMTRGVVHFLLFFIDVNLQRAPLIHEISLIRWSIRGREIRFTLLLTALRY